MTVIRIAFALLRKTPSSRTLFTINKMSNVNYDNIVSRMLATRSISSMPLSKNLTLIQSQKNGDLKVNNNNFKLSVDQNNKPLVVMLCWLLSKRKYTDKYASFYLDQGFDVLNVNINPWQLLWPTKGTQVVASEILKFLEQNSFNPLFLHGFSVGAYLWGEVLVQMVADLKRYQPIIDRIVGQVWDSAADITEIPVGVPRAVFPKNSMMQKTLEQYMLYHLKTFDKVATCHYVRSSQMFHTNLVHAPALFFLSKTDPVGAVSSNQRVRENWERNGVKIYWKLFEKSPHVGHFQKHPKEYMETLYNYMESLDLIAYPEKVKAKL